MLVRPIVTVLVNTYNHEHFIAQCLSSVADQDFPAHQVQTIVVDDGSTDSTPDIIRSFVPDVEYIRKPNGGQVSTLLVSMPEIRGQIVAFLDGDDWWARDKLEKVICAFDKNPAIAAVGHGYFEVDEQGRVLNITCPNREYLLNFDTVESSRFAANLRIFGGTSRLALRKTVLDRALPVPSELPFFDNFVFTQAVAASGAILLTAPLCFYRIHSANLYAGWSSDIARLRRRFLLQQKLIEHLPRRLLNAGIPESHISAFFERERIDTDRLRLILDGGSPYKTFRVERADFRAAYRHPTMGYRFFKLLVLLLTLIMPPRVFYRIRAWYSRQNLRRIRMLLGRAEPAVVDAVHQGSVQRLTSSR